MLTNVPKISNSILFINGFLLTFECISKINDSGLQNELTFKFSKLEMIQEYYANLYKHFFNKICGKCFCLLQKKRSDYFQGVHDILCSSLQFFTPVGGLLLADAMNDGMCC